jgi:hypothetical protein
VWSKVIATAIIAGVAISNSEQNMVDSVIQFYNSVEATLLSAVSMPIWALLIIPLAVVLAFFLLRLGKSKLQKNSSSEINTPTLFVDNYEITIDSHRYGDVVGEQLEKFHGKLNKKLPNDYYLWVVRRWSTKPDEYYPVNRAHILPSRGMNGYEWEVDKCYVGGERDDSRILEVWLVGPEGHLLMSTWSTMSAKYKKLMDYTKTAWTENWLVPAITLTTKDMMHCAQVTLKRN